jgi:hypothetical protein
LYRFIDPNSFKKEDKEKLTVSRRFIIDLSADMSESLQIETQRILPKEKNTKVLE